MGYNPRGCKVLDMTEWLGVSLGSSLWKRRTCITEQGVSLMLTQRFPQLIQPRILDLQWYSSVVLSWAQMAQPLYWSIRLSLDVGFCMLRQVWRWARQLYAAEIINDGAGSTSSSGNKKNPSWMRDLGSTFQAHHAMKPWRRLMRLNQQGYYKTLPVDLLPLIFSPHLPIPLPHGSCNISLQMYISWKLHWFP